MSGAFDPKYRSTESSEPVLRFRDRLSVHVLVERAGVSGALLVCALALLLLFFALAEYAPAGRIVTDIPEGVALRNATSDGVSFVCSTAKGERSFQIAVPAGTVPVLVSARGLRAAVSSEQDDLKRVSHRRAFSSRGELAEVGDVRSVRGWRLAPVIVRAVEGDVFYDSVEVVVGFSVDPGIDGARMAPRAPGMFERIFSATVINYNDAKTWSKPQALSRSFTSPPQVTPFSYTSNWRKLSVMEKGLVRVNGSAVGAPVSSAAVRVFYAGGEPLPQYNAVARPVLKEIPLLMFDGGDGSFDAGDYILFYGEPANHWRYDSTSSPTFIRNVFTNENTYWLTTTGSFPDPAMRMSQIDGTPTGSLTKLTAGRKTLRLESEQLLSRDGRGDIDDFYNWYWSTNTQQRILANLQSPASDPARDDTTRYTLRAIAGSVNLVVDGVSAQSALNPPQDLWSFKMPARSDSRDTIDLSQSAFFSRGPYLDYANVDYFSNLLMANGAQDVRFTDLSGSFDVSVGGVNSAPITLLLNDPRLPQVITGGVLAGSTWEFAATLKANSPNRYFIAEVSSATSPSMISVVATADLRSDTSSQVSYLVIGPRGWEGALNRYINYRESRSGINARFVALEDIYQEFGFGAPDPTAIRDYLKYTFENYPSPAPSSVLFVGDGTYDLRAITANRSDNVLPPYLRSGRFETNYVSDDSYVYFDDFAFLDSDGDHVEGVNFGVDMVPARLPVKNVAQLNTVIDKIIAYESNPDFGPWRNKVTLLADDEFGEFIDEAVHVQQTEDLEQFHLPGQFLRDKIYLWDYPLNSLRERPSVNDALVRTINEGTLILNYVGHGNPSLFAHERVFTNQSDLPRLRNGSRLPLVFTASCSIGFYDDPGTEGMAEELLRMDGGAIMVVSATRLVFSQANALFNRVAYDHIFGPQNLTVAQAVFAAKMTREDALGSKGNDRRYSVFGDPYLRLARPIAKVEFTESPDTLVSLTPTIISGRVVDKFGVPLPTFSGVAEVVVYDSRTTRNHKVLNRFGDVRADVYYDVNGPALFRGSAPVVNGEFAVTFIPSLDISFGATGALVSAYLSGSGTDAIGVRDSVAISPVVPANTDDTGPTISLVLPSRSNFASGDPISPTEEIFVQLSDTSGINLGFGFGHSITLTIDDELTSQTMLNETFVYNEGSFRAGQASVTLPNLAEGEHTFKIKAWDNANNSSTFAFSAVVTQQTDLTIDEMLSYPNPMESSTGFYFTLMAPAEKMEMEIFTVSGIKVFEAEEINLPQGYNQNRFVWDGRDMDGDRVATGVYLYRAVAHPAGSGSAVEESGKLVVVN